MEENYFVEWCLYHTKSYIKSTELGSLDSAISYISSVMLFLHKHDIAFTLYHYYNVFKIKTDEKGMEQLKKVFFLKENK